jgi:hypothetical protein
MRVDFPPAPMMLTHCDGLRFRKVDSCCIGIGLCSWLFEIVDVSHQAGDLGLDLRQECAIGCILIVQELL